MTAHLLLTGGWAECSDATCELLFHLQLSAVEAQLLPSEMLYPLLDAVQPYVLDDKRWRGEKVWLDENGKPHRDYDLPAVVRGDGTLEWWMHGKRHRAGGKPAYIDKRGAQIWSENGEFHRDGDLPARVLADGSRCWYQHGKQQRDGDKPSLIDSHGNQAWHQDGELHRDGDKPAEIYVNGYTTWYRYGEKHRENGPAVILADGTREWWLNGMRSIDPTQLLAARLSGARRVVQA